jgi:hypothetical protein
MRRNRWWEFDWGVERGSAEGALRDLQCLWVWLWGGQRDVVERQSRLWFSAGSWEMGTAGVQLVFRWLAVLSLLPGKRARRMRRRE